MKPDALRERILMWAEEEMRLGRLPSKSDLVLRELLYNGTVPRSNIPGILGVSDRAARRVTGALIETGAIASDSTRAPLRLVFSASLAGRWMPGLFPDQ